jgi:tetratricopeptide (TPR) repeat protein
LARTNVEQRLEQVRQKFKANRQETKNPGKKQVKVAQTSKKSPRPFPKVLLVGIALLVAGAGIFAGLQAQQSLLNESKRTITQVEALKNSTDINALQSAKINAQNTISRLESFPNLPGSAYPQVQADLQILQTQLAAIELNLQAGQNLKTAETLAMEAAVIVQKPPHPLQVWLDAQSKWQQAISLLQAIPENAPVAATAQQKLQSYQSNYQVISKRVELAEKAINLNNQGVQAFQAGETQKATEFFNQALSINPVIPEAYYGRGMVYAQNNEHEKAIQEYTKSINVNQNDADSYFQRARSHYRLENQKQALEDYAKAIEVDPNHAQAYLERGSLRYQMGLQKFGIEDLQTAAKLFTQQGDLQNLKLTQDLLTQWEPSVQPFIEPVPAPKPQADS